MSAAGRSLALLGILLGAARAHAGGPLVLATDGAPVGWDTRSPVAYRTDQGPLGTLTNATAVALVDGLFGTWQVPTATIGFVRAGTIGVDVNGSNFGPFLGPYAGASTPRGENVIVFDADGSIFDTLFGVGTGVIGFAGPVFMSVGAVTVPIGDPVPPGAHLIEAIAFLNGKWIDGVNAPGSGNGELSLARFDAVFVHEFGHFAGLDHTQIHGLFAAPDSDNPFRTTPVETMFPFAVDETQATLGRDDLVAISALYPTAAFLASTGRITGRTLSADGTPLADVNVIARNVADDTDAVSAVSGTDPNRPGAYALPGLAPGASYTVEVQEIDTFHTEGSRVGPFSPPLPLPGRPEFYNGAEESDDPALDDPAARTPITAAAGVTVSAVDVVLNRQRFAVTNVPLEPGSQPNAFAVADFDRDGVADFVATQFGFAPGNVTRFYRGLGAGAFAAPVVIDSFPGNADVVAGQFNADVDDFFDLAVASATLKAVRVYFGDGAGHFGSPATIVDAPNAGPFLPGLAVGDLNGDPFPDLATVAAAADGRATAYALLGSGSGTFTVVGTPLATGSGFPRGGLAIGQLTGSAAGDVVGVASTGGGVNGPPALGILVGNGAGGFVPVRVSLGGISNAIGLRALALGDLNGDGKPDVALSDLFPLGGSNNWTRSFVDILLGDGAGGFALASRHAVPETAQDGIVMADLDGDHHLDVASTGALFGPGSPGAKVTVAFGDGAGGVREVTSVWGLAEFPTRLAAADLDGDGRVDLLVDDGESSAFGLAPAPAYSVLLQAASGLPSTTLPRPTTTTVTITTTSKTSTTSSSTSSTTTSSSTTSSTTAPPPPLSPLAPAADTYIEAGSQATRDHGAADHIDIDASPARIIYLKFDLRGVTAPVTGAFLRLRCTNTSKDGGTVYPVADSTWVEGTRTAAAGAGLTWTQVDTNRDGKVDARDTSPWVPDFTHPVRTIGAVSAGKTLEVDVTAAVQGGPGIYTLAIRSASKDGAAYAAREYATVGLRPQLRLTLGSTAATSAAAPTSTIGSPTRPRSASPT